MTNDSLIYDINDKQPTAAHANNQGLVLLYDPIGKWMSGSWDCVQYRKGVTHWMMLPDAPPITQTREELNEQRFEQWLANYNHGKQLTFEQQTIAHQAFLKGASYV